MQIASSVLNVTAIWRLVLLKGLSDVSVSPTMYRSLNIQLCFLWIFTCVRKYWIFFMCLFVCVCMFVTVKERENACVYSHMPPAARSQGGVWLGSESPTGTAAHRPGNAPRWCETAGWGQWVLWPQRVGKGPTGHSGWWSPRILGSVFQRKDSRQ